MIQKNLSNQNVMSNKIFFYFTAVKVFVVFC